MAMIQNMDPLAVEETGNQTSFEYYETYLQKYEQIVEFYLKKYREEFIEYIRHNAQHLAIAISIYFAFSFCFYCIIMRTKFIKQLGSIRNCKSILFVTAHPDDECMFFGPTIVNLVDTPNTNVYLLCMSTGNYQNLGRKRKNELYDSCKILGIPESNVQIIKSSVLPDDPKTVWNQEIVANLILTFIETYSIDTLITFDRYGVSNHLNHASVFYGVAYLCLEKKLPKKCVAYALETVSLIRKYVAYLDIPLTCVLSSKKYLVPMKKRNVIRQAMRAHESQDVWFRKLYMLASRYIFINSFKEINVLELELDLEIDEGRI